MCFQSPSCTSCSIFLSLFHIFVLFYFTFPSIWFYTLLWHLVICLFLLFFLLSRARMLRMPFIYAWSVRGHPSHRHHSPQIFCDGHVATTPSLWPFPPHTCLPQICTAHPSITLFALFCVCYVPMHSPAPIWTHPYPPESLITPCMSDRACMYFWGNFPAIHGR